MSTPQGIRLEPITDWLCAHVPGISPPLHFALIAGGHSNLTYRIRDARSRTWVLRRPPLGHVLQSAHDMAREHKIIAGLRESPVPVPQALALCEDTTINEAPFYIMNDVSGLVLHDETVAAKLTVAAREVLSRRVVDVLAALHTVDVDAAGLGDLGRKTDYLARQLKRWSRQWEESKTHDVPRMEQTARLLRDKMPAQIGSTIVHGDYRLGNMIVSTPDESQGPAQICAVLDWELCTLGDPLADVGYLLNQWPSPGERPQDNAPTRAGDFLSRDALCEQYATLTGRDLSAIHYYRAFSWWRLAAIGQGVYKRYLAGAMGTDRVVDLETMRANVQRRAETALSLLS